MPQIQIGVQDDAIERQIVRANEIAAHYKSKDYAWIEKTLLLDLKSVSSADAYARQHILNELADLYSYYLLDIERAIEMDQDLMKLGQATGFSKYRLEHDAANQQLLYAKEYRDSYLNVPAEIILDKAAKRIRKNESLLLAEPLRSNKNYDRNGLIQIERDVKADLLRTYKGTKEYFQLISRLIRVEYELYRTTADPEFIASGYAHLLNGELSLDDIYFSEIDFLSVADYLDIAYRNSGNIRLAEYALSLTNKPYIHLRNLDNRWLFNKLVNTRINTLIDGYYARRDFAKMLYYISLNKSRMILEDKARIDSKNASILTAGSESRNPKTGFPSFELFQGKLTGARDYLDFYMSGHYDTITADDNKKIAEANMESATSFAGTRAIKRVGDSGREVEVFITDSLFVTIINNSGKIEVVRLDDSRNLNQIKEQLDKYYKEISDVDSATRGLKIGARTGRTELTLQNLGFIDNLSAALPDSLTVSPDGWLSRYPFDWLLKRKTIRTLNLFTYGDTSKISGMSMVGYFDPAIVAPDSPNEGALPDAEKELETVRLLGIKGTFFFKGDASLANLTRAIPRNILHLSMHGTDNPDDPLYSKLFFAGSSVSREEAYGKAYRKDDANALYAKDMDHYSQLKDNDLVFTAACQTGLTRKSATNQSEIIGILRPLLINRNRNIILTLWSVESESAALFVQSFYSNLAISGNVKEAFFTAQAEVRKLYVYPAFWAPYYLVQNE